MPISTVSKGESHARQHAQKRRVVFFDAKKISAAVERKLAHGGGRIDSSLYETGVNSRRSGFPAQWACSTRLIMTRWISRREIQPGNALDVLYEKLQAKNGDVVGHGNVSVCRAGARQSHAENLSFQLDRGPGLPIIMTGMARKHPQSAAAHAHQRHGDHLWLRHAQPSDPRLFKNASRRRFRRTDRQHRFMPAGDGTVSNFPAARAVTAIT